MAKLRGLIVVPLLLAGTRTEAVSATVMSEPAPLPSATSLVSPVPSATVLIEGRVRERGTRDPVTRAVVVDAAGGIIGQCDETGWFRIAVPEDTETVTVRAPEFAPQTIRVRTRRGVRTTIPVSLTRTEFEAEEVVVRARRDLPEVSQTQIRQHEIKLLPGTAGDAMRAIQALPGVASPSDFSGQLAVRGGGPEDNLYFLDNVPWPVPYHFGGVLSTVHPSLLTTVDLYAAGFGPRWGNADGAVLDAKTRPGRKDGIHGTADVNLVTADALLEGPLGIGNASWTLAGRRSYFDLFAADIVDAMSEESEGGEEAPDFTAFPFFWDIGLSLDVPVSPKNSLRALFMTTRDMLGLILDEDQVEDEDFQGEFRLENRYLSAGVTWQNTAVKGLTSNLTPYYYSVTFDMEFGKGYGIDIVPRIYGLKEEAVWQAGEFAGFEHEIGFGGGIEEQDFTVTGFFPRRVTDEQNEGRRSMDLDTSEETSFADQDIRGYLYLQDRIGLLPNLHLTGGGRFDRSQTVNANEITPRASVEWKPFERTTVTGAWGIYNQDPDLSQLHPDFGNPGLRPSMTRHAVAGVEQRISRFFVGRVEAYRKWFRRLTVGVPDKRLYASQGIGRAEGVECFLRFDRGEKFFGWISYARSMSQRKADGFDAPWRPYDYDQPHIATVVASYGFTPALNLGLKLRYNSGPLITPLEGRYLDMDGRWQGIYGEQNSRRLADYMRLDARLQYSWMFDGWKLIGYIEAINLLNRENPAGLMYSEDLSDTEQINNLPRFGYVGIGIEF